MANVNQTAQQAKLKAMQNALKNIAKATRKEGLAYRLGDKPIEAIPRLSTGALPLDIALGGGVPTGRIMEFFGAESSGKTLIATKTIAECQKKGGICAVVDAEHAFDPTFAAKLGVDIENLYVAQPDHMTEAFTIIDQFVDAGCDLIVLDSTAALVPKEEFESDEVLKTTIGLVARGMSQFLRRITPKLSNNNSTLICINQVRDNIGVMYGDPTTTPGGKALKFYSSVRIRVSRCKDLDVVDNNKLIQQRGIKCTVVKNKTAIPYREATFSVYLDGQEATKDISIDIANISVDNGFALRCNKDKEPKPLGRYYFASTTYIDENGNEQVDELFASPKADFVSQMKDHPHLMKYLLGVIKGEIEKPIYEGVVEEEQTEDEFEAELENDLAEEIDFTTL